MKMAPINGKSFHFNCLSSFLLPPHNILNVLLLIERQKSLIKISSQPGIQPKFKAREIQALLKTTLTLT